MRLAGPEDHLDRPVYHRLEARIRAHVLLCWLTLLLVRIIETRTGATWATVREDLQDLHVGVFTGPAGTFTQTSTPTPATRAALTALDIVPPKKILHLAAATPESAEQPAGLLRREAASSLNCLVTGRLSDPLSVPARQPADSRHQATR